MSQELQQFKGLSVQQPWAEQIMTGEKTIEFRSVPVRYRGSIYIYVSLGKSDLSDAELEAEMATTGRTSPEVL